MKFIFRDRNSGMVGAWNKIFNIEPIHSKDTFEIGFGDIFDKKADAFVSPANSFGFMTGGIDAVYTEKFGVGLEDKLQKKLIEEYNGELPIGQAVIVPTEDENYPFLVAAPTMYVPMIIEGTINVYLAFRATIRAIQEYNDTHVHKIESVLCPGLGTGIGKIPYETCALQMRAAYDAVHKGLNFKRLEDAWKYHESLRRGIVY